MVDKIDGPNQPGSNIGKKVEAKKIEIQGDSIFKKQKGHKKSEYIEETAFLLTVFDKNNDGSISKDEIDCVEDAEYNNQLNEYNKDNKELVLDDAKGVKAQFQREIETAESENKTPKSGLLMPLHVAIQSNIDKKNTYAYVGALKEIISLTNKPNLTKNEKSMLNDFKKLRIYYEKMLSPETIEDSQMLVLEEIKTDEKQNNTEL